MHNYFRSPQSENVYAMHSAKESPEQVYDVTLLHTNNTSTNVKVFEALVKMKQALVTICMFVCSLKPGISHYYLYQLKKKLEGTIIAILV